MQGVTDTAVVPPSRSKTNKFPQTLRKEGAPSPPGGGSHQCLKRMRQTPSFYAQWPGLAWGCALSQGLAHTFLFEVQS